MARHRILSFLLLAGAILVTLLFLEMMVRIVTPQSMRGTWLVTGPRGLNMNKDHGSVQHEFRPANRKLTYYFDKYHRRVPKFFQPSEGSKRILILGDSFAFGWLLAYKKSFVGIMQSEAETKFGKHAFEFINVSTGGWGAADYTTYIENFGKEVRPDLIVIFVGIDDFDRAMERGFYNFSGPKGRLQAANQLAQISRFRDLLRSLPVYNWLLEHSHLVQFGRNAVAKGHLNIWDEGQYGSDHEKDMEIRRMARALFRRLRLYSTAHNMPLLVLTNGWPDVLNNYPWIGKIMLEENINFIDLTPEVGVEVAKHRDNYIIPIDTHPNEAGSKLIAEAAWPYLQVELSKIYAK